MLGLANRADAGSVESLRQSDGSYRVKITGAGDGVLNGMVSRSDLPSMYPDPGIVGINAQAGEIWSTGAQTYPVADPDMTGTPVGGTGFRFADGRSSAYSYWSDVQDAGASQGSFLKYAFGGTMRTLSGVGYDIWDAAVGAEQKPSQLLSGAAKASVNFGPELFNGAANTLKASLDVYSLIAESLGAGEGVFAGFRASNSYNIAPLYGYENKTEAGAAMLANLAIVGGAAKYGSYAIELEAGSAGTLYSNPAGLKLVSPRYQPGVVTYGNDLVLASGRWLDAGTPAAIPLQVARQLEGQPFKTFPDLQTAVWQTIGSDAELLLALGDKELGRCLLAMRLLHPKCFRTPNSGEDSIYITSIPSVWVAQSTI